MKILVIQSKGIALNNTGQGTAIIQFALIAGLLKEGHEVSYLLLSGKSRFQKNLPLMETVLRQESMRGLDCRQFESNNYKEDQATLRQQYNQLKPDVCIVYHFEGIKLVRETIPDAFVVGCSIDLEFLPKLMRLQVLLCYETLPNKLKILARSPSMLTEAFKKWRKTLKYYALADAHINPAAHHAKWIADKFHLPVIYTPNPVAEAVTSIGPKSVDALASPPRFLLLGGLKGVATLSGLYYFADQVLPHLADDIKARKIEVRLIGRDTLEGKLLKQFSEAGITFCGFVPDLTEEMSKASAMLVPTEIDLGFRTRILDAFRYRLAVIAHQSNQLGFPELEHMKNCMLSDDAVKFAGLVRDLANSPQKAIEIGEQGHEDFLKKFGASESIKTISNWLKEFKY